MLRPASHCPFPSIGMTYMPEFGRRRSLDFGTGRSMYVPESLALGVSGRTIEDAERVESVTPAILDTGKLDWVEVSASNITPRGSLVNVVSEAKADKTLFFLG